MDENCKYYKEKYDRLSKREEWLDNEAFKLKNQRNILLVLFIISILTH